MLEAAGSIRVRRLARIPGARGLGARPRNRRADARAWTTGP